MATRAKNTEKRVANLDREGRGRGVGADYRPWIVIHDFSSRGRVHRRLGRVTGRVVHLLSDVEEDVFMKFDEHPDTLDIREQFPLPRAETIAIAARLGVRHPAAHGVPVVMTTDLLVDMPGRQIAIAVKMAQDLTRTTVLKKLEIEREYWRGRGAEWHLVVDESVSRDERIGMQERAEWGHEAIVAADPDTDWGQRADVMLVEIADGCRGRLNDFCARVEARNGWQGGEGLSAVKLLLARRLLVIAGSGRLDAYGDVRQLSIAADAAA